MSRKGMALCFLLTALLAGGLLSACGAEAEPTRARLLQFPLSPVETPPTASPWPTTAPTALPTGTSPATFAFAPATGTPTPAATATPSPTPEPQPVLRRITSGGCCTDPFWSGDSRYVLFIDRPASRPVGVYGVDVQKSGPPVLVTEQIISALGSGGFYVYPDGNAAIVQRVDTGEQYVIRNGGRPVRVSPDGTRLLWQVTDQQGDFDRRRSETWVADLDGSNPRVVAQTVGVGGSQWVDARRILLVGLLVDDKPVVGIGVLTLDEGGANQLIQVAQAARPRGLSVSPEGGWLVYYLTFQPVAADDGLWIVPTDGSAPPRKLDFFGSYRWRDETHLLYVPLEPGVASHTLWEYDVVANTSRRLTDPAYTAFKIANNDWAVSPDGRYVVLLNAADRDLWLLDLTP